MGAATTRWILVRHGQSTANVMPMLSGWMDVALTAEGERQARAVGEVLGAERLVHTVASDLQRASHTAWLALEGRTRGLRTTPALRERALGDWTGLAKDEIERLDAWSRLNTFDRAPPGGESLRDVARRATAFLDTIDRGVPTLVVAHGGVLRALLGLVDGTPTDDAFGTSYVPNATPFVRELPRGAWAKVHRRIAAR